VDAVPVIELGVTGIPVSTVNAKVEDVDVPHALVAVTDKVPLEVGVNVTELVVLTRDPVPEYDQE
jgi:hypothetical protein